MFKRLRKFMGHSARGNYWSCSPFAKWVTRTFGGSSTPKPSYATLEEWDQWKITNEKASPLVYWFTEEFLDTLQRVVYFPYDLLIAVRYYIYNRFICETHKLRSDLEPGQFHEVETRFLHCLFTDLVRFVEVEKAWMQVVWSNEASQFKKPWYAKHPLTRWKPFRCPEAGIEHLKWEMTLTEETWDPETETMVRNNVPTGQAIAAKEVYQLYVWWTSIRPSRPDPYELSGYDAFVSEHKLENIAIGRISPELRTLQSEIFKRVSDIHQQYDDEDDEMLLRLIKIRRSMWT